MYLRQLTAAGLSLAFLAGSATSATAAEEDPAPTNVQVAWADPAFNHVRVTWQEDSPRPNRVFLRVPGKPFEKYIHYVPADAPNQLDLSTWHVKAYSETNMEVGVTVGTEAGATSAVATSPQFDTIVGGYPVLESLTASGANTIRVKWRAGVPMFRDTNPGDPLDQPGPPRFQPVYRRGSAPSVALRQPSTATDITVSGIAPDYEFYVLSVNEWFTGQPGADVHVHATALKAAIPTRVTYGLPTVVTGQINDSGQPRTVVLQARNNATSPWAAATFWEPTTAFRLEVRSPGTRQYRVVVAGPQTVDNHVWFGTASAPVTTTTGYRVVTAKFSQSVINRGAPTVAQLAVQPYISGTALLQRRQTSGWVGVKYVPITYGKANFKMTTGTKGTVAYRYYVPAGTTAGRGIAATFTAPFYLTAR